MAAEGQSIKIFFSYASSPRDEELLTELEKHLATLRRERHIIAWDKRNISAGNEWKREINSNLNSAHIILLLVSPDFIASEYCQSIEMERAMERHLLGEARVIPVILRPADWRTTPFGRLQALPRDATPIILRRPQASAFLEVAMGIREVVEDLRSNGIGTPVPPLPARGYVENNKRESAMVQFSGQQLGNYRLTRLLGQGSFADVYLGEHIDLRGKRVAIKVLRTQLTHDIVRKFKDEANIIANLEHDNIVKVLDFGNEQGTLYLIMEFAPYGSLRYPKGTQLPPDAIVPYVKQVAKALQYAHEQRVIHRDVKPENMLIGSKNQVLLSDFGIAVEFSTRSKMQQDFAGTLAYMAPEQIQGKFTQKSDQYSLAVVVYEWLSGSLPFEGTYAEIITQHLHNSPPSIVERVPTISTETEKVVLKALAKNPDERYSTALEFAYALEKASPASLSIEDENSSVLEKETPPNVQAISTPQDQVPLPPKQVEISPAIPDVESNEALPEQVEISPATQDERQPLDGQNHPEVPPKLNRRIFLLVIGGAVAAVVLVGVGFALDHTIISPPPTPTPTTGTKSSSTVTHQPTATATPSARPTPPPLPNAFYISRHHTNEVDTVAWSPTANLIASGSRDKTVDVWTPVTDNIYTYTGHHDWVFGVAWSPDGKLLASGSVDDTVQVWDPISGTTSTLYSGHSGAVHGVAWSPDGKLIASASDDKTVQIWDANSGTTIRTYTLHTAGVDAVAWSPDGTHIASASKDKTVQVWDAASGKRLFTYPGHTAEVDTVAWSPDGTKIVSGSYYEKTAQVWDAATGKTILIYTGHTNIVRWVAWSPDGTRIASASADWTVQVWDAMTGKQSFTYRGHSSWVHCVSWSPDGTHIASSSADKTVQVWTVG